MLRPLALRSFRATSKSFLIASQPFYTFATRPSYALLQSRRPVVPLRASLFASRRYQSTEAAPTYQLPVDGEKVSIPLNTPSYQLTFTCKKCQERSTHRVSKQGYHNGTVIVQCPGCENRHLIADHLKIFFDESITIEDILKGKNELVKRGRVGTSGDVEFWDDEPKQ